jgi:hypothetical protein
MAVPREAGQPERLLVDRSRRYCGHTLLPRVFHRTNDGFIRGTAGVGAQLPWCERPIAGGAVKNRFADVENTQIDGGSLHHFRTDARRIADRYCDTGFHGHE